MNSLDEDTALQEELYDITSMIQKGVSYEMRLNAMGLERIVDLMGMGYPIITTHKASIPGILNIIKVPEHRFQAWILKQPNDLQDQFNIVSQIQKNRRKENLIENIESIAEQFDSIIESHTQHRDYDHKEAAIILDKKAKSCSTLLKQLVEIEKSERDDGPRDNNKPGDTYNVHVHTSESQLARIRELQNKQGEG